jgi:hypothetical protein
MGPKKYIGLDLDGVLCSDLDLPWDQLTSKELGEFRNKLCPMFVPASQFVIITGRPITELNDTKNWLNKFNIFPEKIYFNPVEPVDWLQVAQHKSDTINKIRHNLTLFVESSHKQVEYIRQKVSSVVPVVHFSDFIANQIYGHSIRL